MNTLPHIRPGLLLTLLLLLAVLESSRAQLMVDPPRPLLTDKKRSLEVTFRNPGTEPTEVQLGFRYTVLRTDSAAGLSLDTNATAEEREKSALEWIKAFPRRFNLAAGQSRVVRLIAAIPSGTLDGEYWADLLVTSSAIDRIRPPMNDTLDSNVNAVALAGMGINFHVSFPLTVRVGETKTGVELGSVQGSIRDSNLVLLVDTRRLGNSAYRGALEATILNPDGSKAAFTGTEFTVTYTRRLKLTVPRLREGQYSLELKTLAQRHGSAAELVLPAEGVLQKHQLSVNGSTVTVQ